MSETPQENIAKLKQNAITIANLANKYYQEALAAIAKIRSIDSAFSHAPIVGGFITPFVVIRLRNKAKRLKNLSIMNRILAQQLYRQAQLLEAAEKKNATPKTTS